MREYALRAKLQSPLHEAGGAEEAGWYNDAWRKVAPATRFAVSGVGRADFGKVQLVESGPPCHFPGFERGSHERD